MTKHRIALLASTLLLASRLAAAAPTTADGWYEEGQTQYTLGNFDKAVEAFKKGFELETVDQKKPAYLYNIAQAYRQANDCKNAVFFYKRFLALKANDTVKPLKPEIKAEVDGWIRDGEACIKQQDDLRAKTPDSTVKPGEDAGKKPDVVAVKPVRPVEPGVHEVKKPTVAVKPTGGGDGEGDTDEGEPNVRTAAAFPAPHTLVARLTGGGSKISAGKLNVPIEGTGALVVGYPFSPNPKTTVEVGAGATFAALPFDNTMTGASESAKMFGLFANAGGRYAVAPKIGVRGDLGLGVLVLSGLDNAGNPFTQGGVGTTGALAMFHLRFGVSADYLLTENLAVTVTPFAFGYSPAKAGLRSDLSSLTSIDFLLGVGYRM